MSIHDASAIVSRLGPCRIALDLAAHGRLAQELALLGCELHALGSDTGSATTAFVEWPLAGSNAALADSLRRLGNVGTLALRSTGKSRELVERILFAEGWRRHPGGMNQGEYHQWSGHALPALSFYQRTPAGGSKGILSRGGLDADEVIARYALAADQVRPGDTVLVDGLDADDGARIVAALCQAGRVQHVADLTQVAPHSLDSIVAVQPETSAGWEARLDSYLSLLKFDGRLILAIRRAGSVDDPLPTSWQQLSQALASRFLIETRHEQGLLTQDPLGPRGFAPIPLDRDSNGPWLFVVASANPLAGAEHRAAYRHASFDQSESQIPTLADFGTAYDNPWLYRPLVQMGERLKNDDTLARLAEHVVSNTRPGSADQGAALTVYGYRVLETRAGSLVGPLIEAIASYVDAEETNGPEVPPHVARWKISLTFLAGRLSELAGDRASAKRWYRATAAADWAQFSPILATKAVGAAFYEARLHIAEGEIEAAREALQQGVAVALGAAACPHAQHMGDPASPLPFYLTELAEVIDMGSQCANALAKLPLLERDPGLFWRQVDVRRFGLATWNTDLQRENLQLQAALLGQRPC